jgi:hypothetical protein
MSALSKLLNPSKKQTDKAIERAELRGTASYLTKKEAAINKKSRGKVVQPESSFNPVPFAAALTTKGSSTYVPVTPDLPRILRKAPPPALAPLRHGPMSFEDARNLVLERQAKQQEQQEKYQIA